MYERQQVRNYDTIYVCVKCVMSWNIYEQETTNTLKTMHIVSDSLSAIEGDTYTGRP